MTNCGALPYIFFAVRMTNRHTSAGFWRAFCDIFHKYTLGGVARSYPIMFPGLYLCGLVRWRHRAMLVYYAKVLPKGG